MRPAGPYGKWICQGVQGPGPQQETEPQPPPKEHIRLRLICVPQAGMGAWAYHGWTRALPADVEIMPVELPAKNSRMGEKPFEATLVDLARDIIDGISLETLSEKPFILFGHSFGAWLVYEIALELRRRGELARADGAIWPQPLQLFVSANRAPHLAGSDNDADKECPVLHDLSEQDFWTQFERRYGRNPDLQSPHIQKYVLPMLQNDFRLIETYFPSDTDPLEIPISAMGASGDGRYLPEQISAWEPCTTSTFSERWFEGKNEPGYWGTPHRYTTDNVGPVLEFLNEELQQIGRAED